MSDRPTLPQGRDPGWPTPTDPPPGSSATSGRPVWILLAMGLVAVIIAAGALAAVVLTRDAGPDAAAGAIEPTTDSLPSPTASTSPSTSMMPPTVPAPTTAVPPATAPPTVAPFAITSARVVRTCGASGNGDCFLSVRVAPSSGSRKLAELDEGDGLQITCTVLGEAVTASVLDRSTNVWARTVDAGYVSMAFVDATGFDPFTDSHPC